MPALLASGRTTAADRARSTTAAPVHLGAGPWPARATRAAARSDGDPRSGLERDHGGSPDQAPRAALRREHREPRRDRKPTIWASQHSPTPHGCAARRASGPASRSHGLPRAHRCPRERAGMLSQLAGALRALTFGRRARQSAAALLAQCVLLGELAGAFERRHDTRQQRAARARRTRRVGDHRGHADLTGARARQTRHWVRSANGPPGKRLDPTSRAEPCRGLARTHHPDIGADATPRGSAPAPNVIVPPPGAESSGSRRRGRALRYAIACRSCPLALLRPPLILRAGLAN